MNKQLPNEVYALKADLETHYPDIKVRVERGGKTSGIWWMDIVTPQTDIVVRWSPEAGFLLEEVDEDALYGELPGEPYEFGQEASTRVKKLLEKRSVSAVGVHTGKGRHFDHGSVRVAGTRKSVREGLSVQMDTDHHVSHGGMLVRSGRG